MVALVTDDGLANVVAAWGAYAASPHYLQFGTGSGQGDTASDLAVPIQTRVAGAIETDTVNVAGDTFKVTGMISASDASSITEVGAFDAAAGGSMGIYGDFAAINLAAGDGIVFAISVTVS